jgi:allantoin racemase
MQANVDRYGHRHHMASMRPLDLRVQEFQTRPDTHERMLEVARKCVHEDGAEVLILGCTAEYGFSKRIEEELGVPVLDPVATSIVYAEFLARQRHNLGWRLSRTGGSESPPEAELASLGFFKGPPPTGASRRVEARDGAKVSS